MCAPGAQGLESIWLCRGRVEVVFPSGRLTEAGDALTAMSNSQRNEQYDSRWNADFPMRSESGGCVFFVFLGRLAGLQPIYLRPALS
jgi:hypothetical protein